MTLGMKDAARVIVFMSISLLTGCSQFDQRWREAANQPETGIEGRWQGKWVSDVDGHCGDLKCVLRREGPNTYLASFSGTFWKVCTFSNDSKLHGYSNDGEFELDGRNDMGFPEGVLFYDGHVNNDLFFLTYRAQFDDGHFVMARP